MEYNVENIYTGDYGMKKFLTVICACLLVISSVFCGCGGSDGKDAGETASQRTEAGETAQSSDETAAEETSAEETEEAVSVAEASAEEVSAQPDLPVTYEYTQVDDSYFDDAVFIGDSISYGLELYVTGKRAEGETVLGGGTFLTSGSLSYGNSLWDVSDESVHPVYNGEKMKLEDAVASIKPGKIYILLGTNDVALYGVEQTVINADTEISRMLEASPGAEIFILSTTPKYSPMESGVDGELKNSDIDALNAAMKQFAEEKGYNFMNIAPLFKDETGGLASDYCSDKEAMGIHFTSAAYDIWIDFLYEYGKQENA